MPKHNLAKVKPNQTQPGPGQPSQTITYETSENYTQPTKLTLANLNQFKPSQVKLVQTELDVTQLDQDTSNQTTLANSTWPILTKSTQSKVSLIQTKLGT